MKGTTCLEVCFENCESIVIPIERIKSFNYGTLTEKTIKYPHKEIKAYKSDYIRLQIEYYDDSELEYDIYESLEPLGMFDSNPTSNYVGDRPNILGRLFHHNDIVDIHIIDVDGEDNKDVYVPWYEADEYDNRYMSVKAENGIIDIEIKAR